MSSREAPPRRSARDFLPVTRAQLEDALDEIRRSPTPARQPSGPGARDFWVSIAAVAISIVSLIAVVFQTQATQEQARAAASALDAQTRTTDIQTIGSVVLTFDANGLAITNRSGISAPPVAVWLLTRGGENDLSEVTGTLSGLPACSTTRLSAELLRSAREEGERTGRAFEPDAALDREAYIALQAPSGAWFLVADTGYFTSIDTDDILESPRPQVEPYELTIDPSSVLRSSRLWELSGDTYWEGADSVSTYQLDSSLAFQGAVTAFGAPVLIDRTSACAAAP